MAAIPEWQYPLYKDSDKAAYSNLKKLAKSGKYPKLVGTPSARDYFLKLLVLSQKMKDYRQFRDRVIKEFSFGEVNLTHTLKESTDLEIPRGIDLSWVVFMQDRRLCEMLDIFQDRVIEFQGTDLEIGEFVVRFLLTQLLTDWRGPLFLVVTEGLKERKIKLSKINQQLKIWDYTQLLRIN